MNSSIDVLSVHGATMETVLLAPADHAALTLQGPSDARVAVEAGSASEVNVTLTLTGTEDLGVVLSTSGLPVNPHGPRNLHFQLYLALIISPWKFLEVPQYFYD